jgi:hypothetical protein
MRVAGFTTLAASTRKARGVPLTANGYTAIAAQGYTPAGSLEPQSSLPLGNDWAPFADFLACENPAATTGGQRLDLSRFVQ